MRAVDFPGSNTNLGKPTDMTDEQCSSLPAQVGEDVNGVGYVLTAWQPNYEDLQALNAGRPLMLQVAAGGQMVPVALWTYDEQFQANC